MVESPAKQQETNDDKLFKKLVNEILARKSLGPVKNFAAEFSDGCKKSQLKV